MNARRAGTLYIAGAALLWSTGGIGIKAVDDPALKVTFYRSVFAAVAMFLFLPRGSGRGRPRSFPFAIAVISYAATLMTFVAATKWTTAANAIFLQYAGAVWVLLLSPIVVHEPIRLRATFAIGAALCGMALFFVGRFDVRGMRGNIMAVLSSIFFAALILSLRKIKESSQSAVTWGNVACALAALPFIFSNLSLTARSLAILACLGFFQIALAYVLFTRGLAHVTATEASLTGMLEPIANPLWVFLFLGERPSPFAIAGAVVVLAAIGWHTLSGRPATDMPALD